MSASPATATTGSAIQIPPAFPDEILTVQEVADLLKFSKRQVWELTRSRGQLRMDYPIPTMRINGNLRFSRRQIEAWLQEISKESIQ